MIAASAGGSLIKGQQPAQNQGIQGPSFGGIGAAPVLYAEGHQPTAQPAAQPAQPGVSPSPATPASQPGWTYGTDPTSAGIQETIQNPAINTAAVNPYQAQVQGVGSGQQYQSQMQDAYYNQATARLDPRFQQEQAALENRLANMGLTRGSEAWNNEMRNFNFGKNDAYGAAMNQAIMNSGAEAQRMQGMELNAGQFANQWGQQGFMNQGQAQQWQNQAFGQQFNQGLQSGQFANQAQNQQFNQGAQNAQIRNQAMGAQMQDATQRYVSDQALQSQQAASQANMQAAAYSADVQHQIAQQQLALQQQGMDWNQFTQGLALPYQLQNLQMQGMYPTGMPNMPNFATAPQIPGGNYMQGAVGQYNQNQDYNSALGAFGGALLNNIPWGSIF